MTLDELKWKLFDALAASPDPRVWGAKEAREQEIALLRRQLDEADK